MSLIDPQLKALAILRGQCDEIDKEIRAIQTKCLHPKATKTSHRNAGYDYDDRWENHHCPDCLKGWQVDLTGYEPSYH